MSAFDMSEFPHCDEERPSFYFFEEDNVDEEHAVSEEPQSDGDGPDDWMAKIVRDAERSATLATSLCKAKGASAVDLEERQSRVVPTLLLLTRPRPLRGRDLKAL